MSGFWTDFWLGVAAFLLWCGAAVLVALGYHTVKVLYLRGCGRRRP